MRKQNTFKLNDLEKKPANGTSMYYGENFQMGPQNIFIPISTTAHTHKDITILERASEDTN